MASKIAERIAKAWYESQGFDSRNIEQYVNELAEFLERTGVDDAYEASDQFHPRHAQCCSSAAAREAIRKLEAVG